MEDIRNYRVSINREMEKLKEKEQAYNNFKHEYEILTKGINPNTEGLDQFVDYLEFSNIKKYSIEDYKKASALLHQIISPIREEKNKEFLRLLPELSKRGLNVSSILNKGIVTSNELTEEELEKLNRVIELFDKIESSLAPLKMNLNTLCYKLKKSLSSLGEKELQLIYGNINEFIALGKLNRWNVTRMSIEDLEEKPNQSSHL